MKIPTYLEAMHQKPKSWKPLELQTYWFIAVVIVGVSSFVILSNALTKSTMTVKEMDMELVAVRSQLYVATNRTLKASP